MYIYTYMHTLSELVKTIWIEFALLEKDPEEDNDLLADKEADEDEVLLLGSPSKIQEFSLS